MWAAKNYTMNEPTDQTEAIGQRLDIFMRKSQLTGVEVAKAIGVVPSIITGLRRGGNYAGDRLMQLFAAYPDLNIGWLLRGEGTMLRQGDHPQVGRLSERLARVREQTEALPEDYPNSDSGAIKLGREATELLMELIFQRAQLLALITDQQNIAWNEP